MSDERQSDRIDAQLEADLKAMAADLPPMPSGLEARMLATAYAEQPLPDVASAQSAPARRGRAVAGQLGRWLSAGFLGAASAAGVAMGYAGPELLPDVYDQALAIVGEDAVRDDLSFDDPLEVFELELEP